MPSASQTDEVKPWCKYWAKEDSKSLFSYVMITYMWWLLGVNQQSSRPTLANAYYPRKKMVDTTFYTISLADAYYRNEASPRSQKKLPHTTYHTQPPIQTWLSYGLFWRYHESTYKWFTRSEDVASQLSMLHTIQSFLKSILNNSKHPSTKAHCERINLLTNNS